MTGYHGGAVATAALAIVVDSISWRWMFVIGAPPALVLVPLVVRHLPESAAYLLAHGRRAEAEEVARRNELQLESAPAVAPHAGEESAAGAAATVRTLFTVRSSGPHRGHTAVLRTAPRPGAVPLPS